MDQVTPLYEAHKSLGAKMVPFGGFLMPVRYTGDLEEHLAVRQHAGIFDVSHMGQVIVHGKNSRAALQRLLTNDVDKLEAGKAIYSPMCYSNGGTVDDVLLYMLGDDRYLMVVNASNIDKDVEWVINQIGNEANIEHESEHWCLLAVQGPKARSIVAGYFDHDDLMKVKRFHFSRDADANSEVIVSRTGYTGEDGFELYAKASDAVSLWNGLLEHGKGDGLIPCGLGARDSLRLEAGLPLYGHELSKDVSPIAAGLGWTVKFAAGDFNGREALLTEREDPRAKTLVGILTEGKRAIPRQGYPIEVDGMQIGEVTSGLFSPVLKQGIGLALVEKGKVACGDTCQLKLRNRSADVEVVKPPFVKKQY